MKSIVDRIEPKGYLERYLNWATSLTDACKEFHLATALTCLSTAVGSKVVFPGFGGMRQWPNLYTLLLGPSGISRKTTCIRMGQSLIKSIEPLLIADGIATRERFISYLAAQPTVLWPIPEFSAVLGAWSRSYADGYKEFVTDWFDPEEVRHKRILGNKKEERESTIKVHNAAINILAGSTLEWLKEKLTEGDLKGGLMGRFLIFPHGEKLRDPGLREPDNEKKQELIDYLKSIYMMKSTWVDTRGVLDDFNAWQKKTQKKLELNYNPDTIGFQSRAVTHTLKLAVLICVSEHAEPQTRYSLTGRQLQKAILLGDWLINGMIELAETGFSKSRTEGYIQKLLQAASGNSGVKRSEAMRILHCDARFFEGIVETAVQRGELAVMREKTATKPVLWYKKVLRKEPVIP